MTRTKRPSTRLVRRSRYLVALVVVLIGFGAFLLLRERPGGTGSPADTCAAMPPELSSELSDAEDCGLFHRNLTQALATTEGGAITRWINTKSGMTGTVKLGATEMRGATACRRAEITLTRVGAPKRAEITACLKDGRWELQKA